MGCQRLTYDKFHSPLKIVYGRYQGSKTGSTSKYQWDLIHDPKNMLFAWAQDEEEGAFIYEFLGKKYEALFDKIYSKNNTVNTEYFDKIQNNVSKNFRPEFTDDELKDFLDEEKEWIKKWEIRARKSPDVLLDVIDAIQKTPEGEKISKIIAQQNKIYIVKTIFDGYDFNVAIYGNREGYELNNIFTKVVVGEIDELFSENNQKHLYVDVNEGRNYWILALFEEEKEEPSLIVQISGKYDVLKAKKWLKFLGIFREPIDGKSLDEIFSSYTFLTPQEIKQIREMIEEVEDEDKKAKYFLTLQEKVPYHNQNDNLGIRRQNIDNGRTNQYVAETMCNLTSLTMAIEYMGISQEDIINMINQDKDLKLPKDLEDAQTEDLLDFIRQKKNYGDRRNSETWDELAEYCGLETEDIIYVSSSQKANLKINQIKGYLEEGKSVLVSLALWKRHIVRLQKIDESGMVIDDPYGAISSISAREFKDNPNTFGYDKNTSDLSFTGRKGNDNPYSWDDFNTKKYTSKGGSITVAGNKYVNNKKTELFETWFKTAIEKKGISESEYTKVEKVVVKEEAEDTEEKYYEYTTKGGVIKFYKVYSSKKQ
jgi:hypothetical protein